MQFGFASCKVHNELAGFRGMWAGGKNKGYKSFFLPHVFKGTARFPHRQHLWAITIIYSCMWVGWAGGCNLSVMWLIAGEQITRFQQEPSEASSSRRSEGETASQLQREFSFSGFIMWHILSLYRKQPRKWKHLQVQTASCSRWNTTRVLVSPKHLQLCDTLVSGRKFEWCGKICVTLSDFWTLHCMYDRKTFAAN